MFLLRILRINLLNTNIVAFQCNSLTQRSLVLNDLEKEAYDLTHHDLIFEQPINDETLAILTERLPRVIPNSFKRAGIDTEKLEVLIY